jgi:hypothetical protein
LIKNEPYKPDLRDLYNLHEFIIINKRVTVLEFGCGWSTLVMLNALLYNKNKFINDVVKLRFNDPFKIFTVDDDKKYLKITSETIKKFHKNYDT